MYQQSPYYQPQPEPPPERPSKRRANRLQIAAGLALIVAAAVGVIVITNRLNDQALSVLAGTACGVAAAIPTSLIIVAVTRRRDEPKREAPQVHQPPAYPYQPPVFMIAPQPYQQPAPPPPRPEPTIGGWTENQRNFTVIGQNSPVSRWDGPGWDDDPQ